MLNSWGPGKFDAELILDGKAFNPQAPLGDKDGSRLAGSSTGWARRLRRPYLWNGAQLSFPWFSALEPPQSLPTCAGSAALNLASARAPSDKPKSRSAMS